MGEFPVFDRGVVRDDVGAAGGRELPRGLREQFRVGDDRERRVGGDRVAGVALWNRRPTRDDAVVARRRRDRDETAVEAVGGHLRHVDWLAAAEGDEVARVGLAGRVDDALDRLEARAVERDRRDAVELVADPVAGDAVGRRARDEKRVAGEVQLVDRGREVVEHAVALKHVPGQLNPRRFIEHTRESTTTVHSVSRLAGRNAVGSVISTAGQSSGFG